MIVDEHGVLSIRLWGLLCTKDCGSGIWEPVATKLDDEDASDESPPHKLPQEEPKIRLFNAEAFTHDLMITWGGITLIL